MLYATLYVHHVFFQRFSLTIQEPKPVLSNNMARWTVHMSGMPETEGRKPPCLITVLNQYYVYGIKSKTTLSKAMYPVQEQIEYYHE